MKTLLHLSDLHVGRSDVSDLQLEAIAATLRRHRFDHIVITGDVTHRGRSDSFERFQTIFAEFLDQGRMTLVPGNHDRNGDDVGTLMMGNERVDVVVADGLYLVRVDSTGPHNRQPINGHSHMTESDLVDIRHALKRAPSKSTVAVLLHHHPYPLPEESLAEKLSRAVGLPFTKELHRQDEFLKETIGRCDYILHGHRHRPSDRLFGHFGGRMTTVCNAGSSSELMRARSFAHDRGTFAAPRWVSLGGLQPIATPKLLNERLAFAQ